jgi:hypothetical protein
MSMPIDYNDPRIKDQIPINQAIAEALIEAMPEGWEAIELSLDWRDAREGMTQALRSPETDEELFVAYELTKVTTQLDEHRDKYDMRWEQAKYTIRKNADGNWEVHAEFLLPNPEGRDGVNL